MGPIAPRWEGEGPERALTCRNLTRREALAAGLGLAALRHGATARADAPPAAPADKVPQADAEYQPTPKGMFSCAVCTFFIKPNSCKVVAGDISPTGWCKLFDLPD